MTTIGRLRDLRAQGFTLDDAIAYAANDHFRELISTLEGRLDRYGQHLPDCTRRLAYEREEEGNPYYYVDCTCGWWEIVNEYDQKKRKTPITR